MKTNDSPIKQQRQRKITIIATLLLCIAIDGCLAANVTQSSKSYVSEWTYASANRTFKHSGTIGYRDHGYMYALCSSDKLPASMDCEIGLDLPSVDKIWNGSVDDNRPTTCKLSLTADPGHEITSLAELERYRNDTAIVVWWQRRQRSQYQVHKIGVTHVAIVDCAIIRQSYYPVDVEKRVVLSNLVIKNDSFDVIVTNEELCRPVGTTTCRVSHDRDGQRIAGGMAPFEVANFDRIITLPCDEDDSFYVHGTDVVSWKFRSLRVSSMGEITPLMTANGVSDPRHLLRATSNARGIYGICVHGRDRFHCAQFDASGEVVMSVEVRVASRMNDNTRWAALYNLGINDALFATGECGNERGCNDFRVGRIRGNVRNTENKTTTTRLPRKLRGFEPRCHRYDAIGGTLAEIGEDGDDYCFYFACSRVVGNASRRSGKKEEKYTRTLRLARFSVKCVPKTYFA